jgi:citrate synthase
MATRTEPNTTENALLKIGDESWEFPILTGSEGERAIDITKLRAKTGHITLDPGYANSGSCTSAITFIDGEEGILHYRGIPIEVLASKSTFMEVSYLLIYGVLPTRAELEKFETSIRRHTMLHEDLKRMYTALPKDAHPMAACSTTVGALATFYPDSLDPRDPEQVDSSIHRLIAKLPTLAAYTYRHHRGLPLVYPENELSYTANFLSMLFKIGTKEYKPSPVLERALDILFILHADHEQNCSTTAMRVIGSSRADPYSALAGAMAALYGPLHGGANEAVLRMLTRIGSVKNIPEFIEGVKRKEQRLMGFGHRIYKAYDPRASIIKRTADEVFEVTGRNPLLDIALELERIALEEDYFIERNLYPNVDFYSGIIYQSMGFPVEMFPVLFAIPRAAGWLAHWEEMITDKEQRIARPLQVFTGPDVRDFVPISDRG